MFQQFVDHYPASHTLLSGNTVIIICYPNDQQNIFFLSHVLQLVSIWILSTLISLPECLVLHAVSAIKEQPCVRCKNILSKSFNLKIYFLCFI